jgi:hypothetical protein
VSELGRPRASVRAELEDFAAASDVLATVALILNLKPLAASPQPLAEPASPEESARNEPTSRRVETPDEGGSHA